MADHTAPPISDATGSRALKARAFRWNLCLVVGAILTVGAAFFELLPILVAYWLGLGLGIGAIGAMVIYFVAHQELRE